MLFTGFVLTSSGPKVLEYNVRFGDPETEALVLLTQGDLAEIMLACTERRLDSVDLGVSSDQQKHAVSVVLASEGYPGSYPKGRKIEFGQVPEGQSGCTLSGAWAENQSLTPFGVFSQAYMSSTRAPRNYKTVPS
jgi:phosphoribosylamine-glycine ligase